jgi:hypothetical protein
MAHKNSRKISNSSRHAAQAQLKLNIIMKLVSLVIVLSGFLAATSAADEGSRDLMTSKGGSTEARRGQPLLVDEDHRLVKKSGKGGSSTSTSRSAAYDFKRNFDASNPLPTTPLTRTPDLPDNHGEGRRQLSKNKNKNKPTGSGSGSGSGSEDDCGKGKGSSSDNSRRRLDSSEDEDDDSECVEPSTQPTTNPSPNPSPNPTDTQPNANPTPNPSTTQPSPNPTDVTAGPSAAPSPSGGVTSDDDDDTDNCNGGCTDDVHLQRQKGRYAHGLLDYEEKPISILSQDGRTVTFEIKHQWGDIDLDHFFVEYNSPGWGHVCLGFDNFTDDGQCVAITAKCIKANSVASVTLTTIEYSAAMNPEWSLPEYQTRPDIPKTCCDYEGGGISRDLSDNDHVAQYVFNLHCLPLHCPLPSSSPSQNLTDN